MQHFKYNDPNNGFLINILQLIKAVASLHSNQDASRLLLSALYVCDPLSASPPTPRPERGAAGALSIGTALTLGGGGDSVLRAGLCIGLSNVTYLLGTPTSASSERGKRSAVAKDTAAERIATIKKPKRAGNPISKPADC